MENRIEWTQNSQVIPYFSRDDIRVFDVAKRTAKTHKQIRGEWSCGRFEIRPLVPDALDWLKGLFIRKETEEYLIDITYDAAYIPRDVKETPLDVLKFPIRIHNALVRSNLDTVEKLMAATDDDLLNVRNVGAGCLEQINLVRKQYENTEKDIVSIEIVVD